MVSFLHQSLTCDDRIVLVAVPGVGAGVAVLGVETALPLGVAVVKRWAVNSRWAENS